MFEIQGSTRRYDAGFFAVDELDVVGPTGEAFTRSVVRHCGAVAVVPLLSSHTALCVRQYRVAFDRPLLEIVAGRRDVADEAPEQAARRELAEEVGLRAGRLLPLSGMESAPGFTDEHLDIFLGLDLEPTAGPEPDGEEEAVMELVEVRLDAVPELIATGALTDAKSIIGLLLARDFVAGVYAGMR